MKGVWIPVFSLQFVELHLLLLQLHLRVVEAALCVLHVGHLVLQLTL